MTRGIFYFLTFCLTSSFAQEKINTIKINEDVSYATVDRVGDLYIQTSGGQIQRYDVNGKLQSVYKDGPAPTLFEPRDGARLFAFFKKDRHYEYLTPSFATSASHGIDSAFVIDPWLVCTSGEHNIWILDAADKTLKKFNPRTSTLEVDVNLIQDPAIDLSMISTMREYQGFVFLLDKRKGVHVFNGMGKWIKTMDAPGLSYFNFIGEEMYYPQGGKLVFLNLFSMESRNMPVNEPFKFTLLTDERLFVVHEHSVDFYSFKP